MYGNDGWIQAEMFYKGIVKYRIAFASSFLALVFFIIPAVTQYLTQSFMMRRVCVDEIGWWIETGMLCKGTTMALYNLSYPLMLPNQGSYTILVPNHPRRDAAINSQLYRSHSCIDKSDRWIKAGMLCIGTATCLLFYPRQIEGSDNTQSCS